MLKALFITDYTNDRLDVKSGVTSALSNLINGFSFFADEIEILVLTQSNMDSKKKEYSNINIIWREPKIKLFAFIKLFDILINRSYSIKSEIKRFQPDIIHIHTTGPYLLSVHGLSKSNIVVTQHGVLNEELKTQIGFFPKLKFFFKAFIERYYFPFFENIVFISSYNKEKFPKSILDKKTTVLIPNAIDLKINEKKEKRLLAKKILYVGAINQRKNLLLLLEALFLLKQKGLEIHLTIAGGSKETKYFQTIQSYIKHKNLRGNTTFLGWVPNSKIRNFLSENDFLVLPSNQETLPVTIIESFSVGTPVIATKVGGIPEMISDGQNGFLFKPNDSKHLVCILEDAYKNGDRSNYIKLSDNAFETACRKYSSKTVAAKHIKFYEQVIEKNNDMALTQTAGL